MSCGQLPAGCIIAGETVFDGGFYLFDAAGVAVDSTAATLTYTWTRQGDSVAAISLTEISAGVSRGVGIMSEVNGVTATVSATLTGALTAGVYTVVWTVTVAGVVWIRTRYVTVEEAP